MPPVYGAFSRSIIGNQRTVIPVPLNQKNNLYSLDFNQLESQITAKTKLLIVCHPHNPIGKIWTVNELIHLGDIYLKYNLLIISDKIPQDLIFNHRSQYRPFANIHPDYAEYSMICTSPSKSFNLLCPNKKYLAIDLTDFLSLMRMNLTTRFVFFILSQQ
jgi:cystathionine beta-lyase